MAGMAKVASKSNHVKMKISMQTTFNKTICILAVLHKKRCMDLSSFLGIKKFDSLS